MTTQLNDIEVVFAGDYRTEPCRALAKGVKKGNAGALMRSALLLAPLVPEDAVLVPVPSHTGRATVTLTLAELLSGILARSGHTATVCDCLRGSRRRSFCEAKRRGLTMTEEEFGFALRKGAAVPEDGGILLVDNVVATGTTSEFASRALPRKARALAVAYDSQALRTAPAPPASGRSTSVGAPEGDRRRDPPKRTQFTQSITKKHKHHGTHSE